MVQVVQVVQLDFNFLNKKYNIFNLTCEKV